MMDEQRSDAWYRARRGKITSSEIHKILGKDLTTETSTTYLLEKVAEKLGGQEGAGDTVMVASLAWGIELEPVAVDLYNSTREQKAEKASFMPMNEYYGGSPDGIVAPDGIIEVKCPYRSVNHLKHMMIDSPEKFKKTSKEYYYQCISNMICAGASWCDFISYDPRMEEEYQLFVFRLHWDEEEATFVRARVDEAAVRMDEIKQQLSSRLHK